MNDKKSLSERTTNVFDGITYTLPVLSNPNAIKTYLGTRSLQGISLMFGQNDKAAASQISPLAYKLLSLNDSKLIEYVTIGYQDESEAQDNLWGDYITLVRADKSIRGREIKEIAHPIFVASKKALMSLGMGYVNQQKAIAYRAEQEIKIAQTLIGNTPAEKRLRYISALLNEAIAAHGGQIQFHQIDTNGQLLYSVKGNCNGCQATSETMKQIKELVKGFAETKDVVKGFIDVTSQVNSAAKPSTPKVQ